MINLNDSEKIAKKVCEIAKGAGKKILDIYNNEDLNIDIKDKADGSPITLADKASHNFIESELKKHFPEIPFLSEESDDLSYETRKNWQTFWLVDPLDGTKEFIKRNGEFTVNIALIHYNEPILGVVYLPVFDKLYYGGKSFGSFFINSNNEKIKIHTGEHYSSLSKITLVASRSHMSKEVEDFKEDLESRGKEVTLISSGSSIKFCMVAEGSADVYPRLVPTMEWDTAAAHSVVLGSGGKVLDFKTKQALTYNKENLKNPWFIVE